MSGYSEDLRRRIVSAVEDGMSKAQAARTFSVSLSSVKRYVNKAHRGESLTPKKSPGSAPKLDREGKQATRRRPPRTPLCHPSRSLRLHRGHHRTLSVSRSTMCRAIARIGPTRKKGDKRGTSRYRARRVREGSLAGDGGREDRCREIGVRGRVRHAHLLGAALRLRTKRQAIVRLSVPRKRGKNTTVLSSMTLSGMGPSLAVEGATTALVFETYVEQVLAPSLRKGQIVLMDNLSAHRPKRGG